MSDLLKHPDYTQQQKQLQQQQLNQHYQQHFTTQRQH